MSCVTPTVATTCPQVTARFLSRALSLFLFPLCRPPASGPLYVIFSWWRSPFLSHTSSLTIPVSVSLLFTDTPSRLSGFREAEAQSEVG